MSGTDTQPGIDGGAPQLTVSQAIANLKQTADKGDRYYAAWWIGRFRVKHPEAIAALLDALQDETDLAPDGGFPLRRNAARALGKVGDHSVVPALIDCLACADYYVREAAAQSLEMLNAKGSLGALVELLAGGVEAAVGIPGKPHLIQPYNAILEAIGRLGNQQTVTQVEPFLDHGAPQVKNAAARAMYQLTGEGHYADILLETLRCDDLQLRRSALLDLGEIGYLPAAEAIAQTLAENSIKLIALKGLLEREIEQAGELVSADARRVMTLMDGLL
ncbi:MAG: HEAT repeat domain-containing protein [Cyanobacteria bacterium J06606_4]